MNEEKVASGGQETILQEAPALTAEDAEIIKHVLARLYPLFEEDKVPGSVIAELGKLVGYPAPKEVEEEKPYPAPVQAAEKKAEAQDELAQELERQKKQAAEELKKATERLAELEKALATERMIREEREFETNIREKLPTVTALDPKLPGALFVLKGVDQEKLTSLLASLEKVEGLIKASPLLKELGSKEVTDESPWDTLNKQAKELVEKGLEPTMERARVRILSQDPDLYRKLRG